MKTYPLKINSLQELIHKDHHSNAKSQIMPIQRLINSKYILISHAQMSRTQCLEKRPIRGIQRSRCSPLSFCLLFCFFLIKKAVWSQ